MSHPAWVSSCLPDITVDGLGPCKLPTALQPAVVRRDCSLNAQVTAVPTQARELRGPALTISLQNPTVYEFRCSGPNHTPCTTNTLPLSEEFDFELSAGPIIQSTEAHSATGPREGWSSEK